MCVGLPKERGGPLGKSGELPGKSGKLPGNLWIAAKFHSERTSGEVAGELLGKSRDMPEAGGSLTSLLATHQIYLQSKARSGSGKPEVSSP